jgi:hypothetical protein
MNAASTPCTRTPKRQSIRSRKVQPPIPPALATAMERLAGHAPAIGASKIGSWRPYCAQKAAARSHGREFVFGQTDAVIVSP